MEMESTSRLTSVAVVDIYLKAKKRGASRDVHVILCNINFIYAGIFAHAY